MQIFLCNECRRVWVRASESSLITFLRLVFSGYCFYVFFFFFEIFISFRIFLYFTRSMKILTGRRHWVLAEESPRLTTMDDNNTLTVFAGYYNRSLFPLPAFLNDVAGIHLESHQVKRNQDTCPRILSDMHRTRFAVLQYLCLFARVFLPPQAYFQT